MAVVFDSSGTAQASGNGTSLNLTTLTVGTGSNRYILAALHWDTNTSLPSITWDSVALSEIQTNNDGAEESDERALVAPNSGNLILAASWTSSSNVVLGAAEFSGVDQTTPRVIADDLITTGNSVTPSITITSAPGDATLAFVTMASVPATIDADDQTRVYLVNATGVRAGMTYALGGSSNTHTWTLSASQPWHCFGVHIKAAAAAAAAAGGFRSRIAGGLVVGG